MGGVGGEGKGRGEEEAGQREGAATRRSQWQPCRPVGSSADGAILTVAEGLGHDTPAPVSSGIGGTLRRRGLREVALS